MTHVLVVDHLSESRVALETLITDAGARAVEAANHCRALELIERHAVDIILIGTTNDPTRTAEIVRMVQERAPDVPIVMVPAATAETVVTRRVRNLVRAALVQFPGERDARERNDSPEVAPLIPVQDGLRPVVQGKFFAVGTEKLYVRGVTYGPFSPEEDGSRFPGPNIVERDFALMAANGINAVRTYTMPPRPVLDAAARYNLRVLAGTPWEQNVTFLDDRKGMREIERSVRGQVAASAGHPAVLGYVVGGAIPRDIVRWYGQGRIESFIERLFGAAKDEDPGALVTYANSPQTEFLLLPFIDFVSFNVYPESNARFDEYIARLQNITGNRPLVISEIGVDGADNRIPQAQILTRHVRTIFDRGCAGCFLFAWTDECAGDERVRGSREFGLTDCGRQPKAAMRAVRNAFADVPFRHDSGPLPRVTVAVCSYNGSRTLGRALDGIRRLDYPDYETIVVDDGSTDSVPEIAREYGVRLISTPNSGLSAARNTALEAATGEIIAYIDDDAIPDPHWLRYLVATITAGEYAGVGGPNIPPPGDGPVAECVGKAPGGPNHVLFTDMTAEHIPGCNMAFWANRLRAIGGFDPLFRFAGDDVDLCWRLLDRGWKIAFSPGAVVWHHRRNSIRGYWQQQRGYGRSEAILAVKWPEKYNSGGNAKWAGRIYENGAPPGGGSGQSRLHDPIAGVLPYFLIKTIKPLALVAFAAAGSSVRDARAFLTLVTLHLLHRRAKRWGRRVQHLMGWRSRSVWRYMIPRKREVSVEFAERHTAVERLRTMERVLRQTGAMFVRSGDTHLEIRGGLLGSARVEFTIEDREDRRQVARLRSSPQPALASVLPPALGLLAVSLYAVVSDAHVAAAIFVGMAAIIVVRMFGDCAMATATWLSAVERFSREPSESIETGSSTEKRPSVGDSAAIGRPVRASGR